jgi:hypothetical protein
MGRSSLLPSRGLRKDIVRSQLSSIQLARVVLSEALNGFQTSLSTCSLYRHSFIPPPEPPISCRPEREKLKMVSNANLIPAKRPLNSRATKWSKPNAYDSVFGAISSPKAASAPEATHWLLYHT